MTEIQKAKLEVYTGLAERTCGTIEGYIHIMNSYLENNDIKAAKDWQTRIDNYAGILQLLTFKAVEMIQTNGREWELNHETLASEADTLS
jgi:hypothetical protein